MLKVKYINHSILPKLYTGSCYTHQKYHSYSVGGACCSLDTSRATNDHLTAMKTNKKYAFQLNAKMSGQQIKQVYTKTKHL